MLFQIGMHKLLAVLGQALQPIRKSMVHFYITIDFICNMTLLLLLQPSTGTDENVSQSQIHAKTKDDPLPVGRRLPPGS